MFGLPLTKRRPEELGFCIQMNIAIDYDNTYTADPEGWTEFIKMMKARGHEVICVTARDDLVMGEPVRRDLGGLIPIVFAAGEWKQVAAERRGWKINVWIDDMPQTIAKPVQILGK